MTINLRFVPANEATLDESRLKTKVFDPKKPLAPQRQWGFMNVQLLDYSRSHEVIFEGSFAEANEYLNTNNYEPLIGSGMWVKKPPLTIYQRIATLILQLKGYINGLATGISNRKTFRRIT